MLRAHGCGVDLEAFGQFAQDVELTLVVRIGIWPGQFDPVNSIGIAIDDVADGLKYRQAVAMALVQPFNVLVQLIAQALEFQRLGAPYLGIDITLRIPRAVQLVDHVELTRFARMQFQAELAQPHFAQAAIDHVERGNLFRHEQHALAFGQALGDQVGNGLALAGAGRADQHEVLALGACHHGRQLRRIGRQRAKGLLGRIVRIEPLGQWKRQGGLRARLIRLARRIDQVAHHGALAQLVGALRQVHPHQVLGERERRQHHFVRDFPALDVAHRVRDGAPDLRHVEPGAIARQRAIEHAQVELEVLPQHFDQGGIEARLVLVQAHRETRARALALQRHRHQDQRRLVYLPRLVVAGPVEKAQRQEQGIGAALLQGGAGAAVQVHQPHLELLGIDADKHLAPRQRIERMFAPHVLARALLVQGLVARIAALHQLRSGHQPDRRAFRQRVFQRCRLGRVEPQGLFAALEIEQVVAQRQVEQLALPARQPVLGIERGGILRRIVRQIGGAVVEGGGSRLHGVAVGCRKAMAFRAGQRLDALHARAADIDQQFELVLHRLGQLAGGYLRRMGKRWRRPGGGQRGLEQHQFLQAQALADGRHVIDHHRGKLFLAQPDAGKRMPLGEHDDGIEAGLLQRRAKQQGQVEAGGNAAIHQL